MQILEDVRFFGWLQQFGIISDPLWGTGDRLTFAEGPPVERRWRPAGIVSDVPGFVSAALDAAQAGGPWWLWRRGGGPWMDEFGSEGGLRNASLDRLLEGLGYGGASGALRLGIKEMTDVWLIVNAFFLFAWSVGEDLYVVPDDCSCILLFSHEGWLEARFPDEARAAAFTDDVSQVANRMEPPAPRRGADSIGPVTPG
jgi:hypothetical protein